MDSLCAVWKDNVSSTQLIGASGLPALSLMARPNNNKLSCHLALVVMYFTECINCCAGGEGG